MKIKLTLKRMLSMCPEAWYIFIRTLQLCCVLCLCASALLFEFHSGMMGNYKLYMLSIALNETSQAVLLIGVIVSFCIEALQS